MEIIAIAAADCRFGIAAPPNLDCDPMIPWNLREDIDHFWSTVNGKCVIAGKNTVHRMGRTGVERINLFPVSSKASSLFGAKAYTTPHYALSAALQTGAEEVYVAGGERVYGPLMSLCNKLILTRVFGDYGCTKFINVQLEDWVVDEYDVFEQYYRFVLIRKIFTAAT